MEAYLNSLVNSLNEEIIIANLERIEDGLPTLPHVYLKILGQSDLLINSEISKSITII
jgi:hypothetical protein